MGSIGHGDDWTAVIAHAGQPIAPHDLWSSWGTDPIVYSALFAVGWLYLRGLRRLWATAGVGHGVPWWRACAFLAGLAVCWVGLESPLDAAASALFSAHMLQHELLTVVGAPLLVLGDPLVAVARGLPPRWRRRLGGAERLLTGAGRPSQRGWWLAGWFGVFVASFWVWHIPGLYNAALRNDALHSLQHASFLAGALGFWWAVTGRHRHRSPLPGIALLFGAILQGAWGGLLFVFANRAYYEPYRTTTQAWGLTPLEDLSAGGAIMWTAELVLITAAAVLMGTWMASMERMQRDQAEPAGQPPGKG